MPTVGSVVEGAAASIVVGTTTPLAAGAAPTVANAGTSSAAVLNFGIPVGANGAAGAPGSQGPAGATGATGTAATIAVGTVTPLAAGASPTIVNGGTSSAAVLNFGMPADAVTSVASRTGAVILSKTDVGLGNVDNTADAAKPVSTAQQTAIAAASTTDRARVNHTGSQTASTISDFSTAADARITVQKGVVSGIAPLDSGSKIPASYLPALALTSTFTVASQAAQLALVAHEGVVAIRTDLSQTFIHNGGSSGTMTDWSVLATPTDAVSSVAGRTGVVTLMATDVGLGSVNNTGDAAKPVSTAQQAAIDAVSTTDRARANHTGSQTASTISDFSTAADARITAQKGAASGVAPLNAASKIASTYLSLTPADVGLVNVNNTADVVKPVSTAQQTAIDAASTTDRARANHTGTQLANTISDFSTAADARITAQKGVASGVAPLDATSKIASTYLPVVGTVPTGGTTGQVLSKSSATDYATGWSTPANAVSSVAGRTGAVTLTSTDVGLANVTNTADTAKPVSAAQQTAIDAASTTDRVRANHTGTQTAATISDFSAAADARISAQRGLASGLAPLDGSSKIPSTYLPASASLTTLRLYYAAAYTASVGQFVVVDPPPGGTVVTLPSSPANDAMVAIRNAAFPGQSRTVTLSTASGATINYSISSFLLRPGRSLYLQYNSGTLEWQILASHQPVPMVPTVMTAAYTAAAGDLVLVDASAGPVTITLPTNNMNTPLGGQVGVKKIDSSANAVTVYSGSSSWYIDGSPNYVLSAANASVVMQAETITGWQWRIIGSSSAVSSSAVSSVAGRTGVVTLAKADVGLGNVDNTADITKPVSTAQQTAIDAVSTTDRARANHTGTQLANTISDFSTAADARITTQKGVANGLVPLDNTSKIAINYLPAIAISSTFTVASQAAQLALTAQEGDVAIRTDLSQSYIQNGGSAGTMADWTLLATPTSPVSSVAGRTGAVTLSSTDVGLSNVNNTTDAAKPVSTAQQAAIDTASTADRARANHTGTQFASTISDFSTAADARITAQKGIASGLAPLDATSKIASTYLPNDLPTGGTSGQVLAKTSATDYATGWTTPTGAVSSVAGRTGVVTLTATDVGLGSVTNTADSAKPVSTAQQTAIDAASTTDRARVNHTGTQFASTISDFSTAADARITAQKGVSLGLAPLDASSKIASTYLPVVGTVPIGGTTGQVLSKTSGTDYAVTWTTPSSGGSTPVRATATFTTSGAVAGTNYTGTVTMASGYRLLAVQTSAAARVRLYTDVASRTADLTRAITTVEPDNSGLVLDYLTVNTTTQKLAPTVDAYSMETVPSSAIPITVTPTGATTVVVTLTYVGLE